MELRDIISRIEAASGIFELSRVTQYRGYLEGVGEIEVTVTDRGEGHQYRHAVSARTLDLPVERLAQGNPERELETAIAVVHWDALQR